MCSWKKSQSKIIFELVEEELDSRLASVPIEEFESLKKDEMPQLEGLIASWINVTFPLSVKLEEFLRNPLRKRGNI